MSLFPSPGLGMRAGTRSCTKAALMSTLMLTGKICGSWHIWKTSLSKPMRENGGCVTSHLSERIKTRRLESLSCCLHSQELRLIKSQVMAHPLDPNNYYRSSRHSLHSGITCWFWRKMSFGESKECGAALVSIFRILLPLGERKSGRMQLCYWDTKHQKAECKILTAAPLML